MIATPRITVSSEARPDPRRDQLRGRGGSDEQREHQQHAGDLRGRRDRKTEDEQEQQRQGAHGHAAGSGDPLVDGREQQRAPGDREEGQSERSDDRQQQNLPAGDAEEVAEEHVLIAGEHALVEAEEQKPARQTERLNGSGDRGLLAAVASGARARRASDHERRGAAEREVAGGGRQPDQNRAGRAGERHHRQRVSGEALAPQDHEPAGDAGEDRDDRAGLERVDHERKRGQLPEIRHRVKRQARRAQ